ncbi:unnamed protein product, partial [Porites lobata]
QDTDKPSAQIEALHLQVVNYHVNQIIKDWSVSAPNSHLVGGMKYHDGKLIVPITGRYNIYLHTYFHSTYGRIYVDVNGKSVTMTQTPGTTVHAAGFFSLKAGDIITVPAAVNCKLYMAFIHTYFGAYLI